MISQDNPDAPLTFQESKVLVQENNDLRFENTQLKKEVKQKIERIEESFEKLANAMQRIAELEEAVKKTSFITASNVQNESQMSVENAKYRTLLQVVSTPVTITQTGDYILYSDPVKRLLEIRKPSPRP